MNRRECLAVLAAGSLLPRVPTQEPAAAAEPPARAGYKQSVARWCYRDIPLDALCQQAKKIGLSSVEILGEKEWDVPAKYGLTCAMANGPSGIPRGWNRVEFHDHLVQESERLLPLIAAAKLPNMIVFSGNRAGLSDELGIKNTVAGLRRIMPTAEKLGVTVCLELLNSKVDHHDYQCDHTAWGAQVIDGVGSERCKLLYDIYHMQIMEGDVIRTIREHKDRIGHFHTAGVPGRHELDDTQELNYKAIARAIADLGFEGFIAHEFVPTRAPMQCLSDAYGIFAL